MPIKVPNGLPAIQTLNDENIFVMQEMRASTQDIRPLEILLLNLMPTKIDTETQFSRLLSNSPLQVNLTLLRQTVHHSHNISEEHLISFYKTFDDVKGEKFDGMIITGAPVEKMPFEEVEYWNELCSIMDWSVHNVHSTLHICWGAQAGLYHHYGIPKVPLEKKLFGVFPHTIDNPGCMLTRGFDVPFMAPHSRHTTVLRKDIEQVDALKIVASSAEAGVYAVKTDKGRQIFVMGHSEYDQRTLEKEYLRDKKAGLPIEVPKNYYPNDDDTQEPMITWRAHAHLLFSNWLNYYVYQTTPYDRKAIG